MGDDMEWGSEEQLAERLHTVKAELAAERKLADDLAAALRHLAKAHLQRNFICTQAAIALAAHDEARGQQ